MPDKNDAGHASAYAQKDVNDTFRGGARAVAFLGQINSASVVMLADTGIVTAAQASAIAEGILALERTAAEQTSGDYLDYEKRLVDRIGAQASLVHAGRSRQDIASTLSRMNLREDLLDTCEALLQVCESVLQLAAQHRDTLIPAYTHGVQAQPTTFAHYLLALSGALARQLERMMQIHARLNRCPLGAAALSTSSFPIDRPQLARLLGFAGVVENAYDANHLAPVDSCLEFAGALAISAVQISQFAQDLHAQYAAPTPWLTMQAGELMGISSLMPQKRNPAALEQLRAQSSLLLSDMQAPFLLAHNVRTGMFDYRSYDPLPAQRPIALFTLLNKVIRGLVVDKAQARAEVDADYSTVTEIADALMQQAQVPFRVGHHFASVLTDHGRARKIRLEEIGYEAAAQLYQQQNGTPFPLDAPAYAQCVDPERMVFNRRGLGGPQHVEVDRMLAVETDAVQSVRHWHAQARQALRSTHEALMEQVRGLAGSAVDNKNMEGRGDSA
jgi:argininosuccinate lyase